MPYIMLPYTSSRLHVTIAHQGALAHRTGRQDPPERAEPGAARAFQALRAAMRTGSHTEAQGGAYARSRWSISSTRM